MRQKWWWRDERRASVARMTATIIMVLCLTAGHGTHATAVAQSCYNYLDCEYPECLASGVLLTDCRSDDIGIDAGVSYVCKAKVTDPATQETSWQLCPPGNCDKGLYKITGEVVDVCAPCDRGSYTSTPSSATGCTQCPAGKYQLGLFGTSESKCTECAPGSYKTSPPGVDGPCYQCAAGTYNPSIGSSACTACNSGWFAATTGAIECIPCSEPPGDHYYLVSACTASQNAVWQTCTQCDAAAGMAMSKKCTRANNTHCSPWVSACGPSQRRYDENWVNGYRCRQGQYLRGFNSSQKVDCRQCPLDMVGRNGIYCEWCNDEDMEVPYWLDQSSCVCNPPAIMNSTGGCACPDGSYHYRNRSETRRGIRARCEPCPVNTYGVAGLCIGCGPGKHTYGGTGATTCAECEIGTYRLSSQSRCQNCSQRGYYAPNSTSNACVACNKSCTNANWGWRDDGVCPGKGNEAFRMCAVCDTDLPPHATWIGSCIYQCNTGYYRREEGGGGCAACSTTPCAAGFMWRDCAADADRGCEEECVNTSKPMFNSKWVVADGNKYQVLDSKTGGVAPRRSWGCPWECEEGYDATVADYWMFQIHECALHT